MNRRILSRSIGSKASNLPCTYGITVSDKEMTTLEDVMMAHDVEEDVLYSDSDSDSEAEDGGEEQHENLICRID